MHLVKPSSGPLGAARSLRKVPEDHTSKLARIHINQSSYVSKSLTLTSLEREDVNVVCLGSCPESAIPIGPWGSSVGCSFAKKLPLVSQVFEHVGLHPSYDPRNLQAPNLGGGIGAMPRGCPNPPGRNQEENAHRSGHCSQSNPQFSPLLGVPTGFGGPGTVLENLVPCHYGCDVPDPRRHVPRAATSAQTVPNCRSDRFDGTWNRVACCAKAGVHRVRGEKEICTWDPRTKREWTTFVVVQRVRKQAASFSGNHRQSRSETNCGCVETSELNEQSSKPPVAA